MPKKTKMGSFIFLPSLVPEIFNFKVAKIYKNSDLPLAWPAHMIMAEEQKNISTFVFGFCWSGDVINRSLLVIPKNPGVRKNRNQLTEVMQIQRSFNASVLRYI